jgi:hypothetical protein
MWVDLWRRSRYRLNMLLCVCLSDLSIEGLKVEFLQSCSRWCDWSDFNPGCSGTIVEESIAT